jgi:hypothetical protein
MILREEMSFALLSNIPTQIKQCSLSATYGQGDQMS